METAWRLQISQAFFVHIYFVNNKTALKTGWKLGYWLMLPGFLICIKQFLTTIGCSLSRSTLCMHVCLCEQKNLAPV